ncbi:expressed unknown protein [Seminavis robusta]|uniref:Uncharacterized protein n=1 Tax=Seminavis robusta TaxID=568900 RepID=A0A9N8DUL8_9STRA|nr:expressed unknown protein [Seminavis robusta]|eukprot:Sro260_g101540.1 n/a (349) ;mRNA; r:29824-31034
MDPDGSHATQDYIPVASATPIAHQETSTATNTPHISVLEVVGEIGNAPIVARSRTRSGGQGEERKVEEPEPSPLPTKGLRNRQPTANKNILGKAANQQQEQEVRAVAKGATSATAAKYGLRRPKNYQAQPEVEPAHVLAPMPPQQDEMDTKASSPPPSPPGTSLTQTTADQNDPTNVRQTTSRSSSPSDRHPAWLPPDLHHIKGSAVGSTDIILKPAAVSQNQDLQNIPHQPPSSPSPPQAAISNEEAPSIPYSLGIGTNTIAPSSTTTAAGTGTNSRGTILASAQLVESEIEPVSAHVVDPSRNCLPDTSTADYDISPITATNTEPLYIAIISSSLSMAILEPISSA